MNKKLIIGIGIGLAFILNGWFWAHFYVQPPIKKIEWQCVVCRGYMMPATEVPKKLNVVPLVNAQTPKPTTRPLTEEDIVKQAKNGDILWNIYMLESTRGKNDGCRKEGKFGGFGVMSAGKVMCYDTFQQAVDRAAYWYEKIAKGNTLDESLCIYNTGVKQPMCHYSVTYHSL